MEFLLVCLIVTTLANAGVGEEIHHHSTDGVVEKIHKNATDFMADDADPDDLEAFRKANAPRPLPSGKHRAAAAATPQKLGVSLGGIQQLVKSLPFSPPQVLSSLVTLAGSIASLPPNDPNIVKAMTVTKSMETNWAGLTSTDPVAIGKAVCSIVATASAFVPPPYGMIVSSVVGVINNLLGGARPPGAGGPLAGPPSMSEIVGQVMQKELRQQYMSQLSGKVQGALDALSANQDFLTGYAEVNHTLSDRDYIMMTSQFEFLNKLELRGEMMALIQKLSASKKKEDAAGALKLIDGYLVMTSMVEVLMHTMKSILERDPQTLTSAANLGRAIESTRVKSKRYLEFLRNPKQENGVIFAMYNPAQNPNLETYLDSVQITMPTVTLSGCYHLADKTDKRVKQKKAFSVGYTDAEVFQFTQKGKFWMVKTADGLVCSSASSKFLEINKSDCDMENDRALFKIYAFADGGYMIMNKQWPTSPLRLRQKSKTDDSKAISVSSAEKDWDENNPEYVWQLKEVPCPLGKAK